MAEEIEPGTWVELHRIELPAAGRAPQVPADTRGLPLKLQVKGFLVEAATVGEEAEIETVTGRRQRGTLAVVNPPYLHSFGAPIPELCTIGAEARAILREGGERS